MDLDFRAFGEDADRIKTTGEKLRWVEENRYSKRRDLKHTLKGYVGSVAFEGALAPFMPILRMGQYVHVGKAAVFGQGWYVVERRGLT
jgi:hypothetical protein